MSDTYTHCLYHANCPDGFTAAWVARRRFPEVKLVPVSYGQPFPVLPVGSSVLIVDFSYPPEQLQMHAELGVKITLLDHHKTALEMYEGAQTGFFEHLELDMSRSGAGMAWDFLRPTEVRPLLVDYVEDRDLWRFELPDSKIISTLFMATPMDLDSWDLLADDLAFDFPSTLRTAHVVAGYRDMMIAEAVRNARKMMIDGQQVPVAPSLYSIGSDVAGELAHGYPFAAYYVDKPDVRQFGLRSTDDSSVDVSAIAQKYGGGGHFHAAGFTVPRGDRLAKS